MSRYRLKEANQQRIYQQEGESIDSISKSANNKSDYEQSEIKKADNTLGALTMKFVKLIQEQKDKTIQIQSVSKWLNIQKRRIYDITNVLEGIGYIEKIGKNRMKWIGGTMDIHMKDDLQELEKEIVILEQKQKQADAQIQLLKQKINDQSDANKNLNYLYKFDLKEVMLQINTDRMIIYSGAKGDEIQIGSNPETGCCEISIQSMETKQSMFYCSLIRNNMQICDKLIEQQNEQLLVKKNSSKLLFGHENKLQNFRHQQQRQQSSENNDDLHLSVLYKQSLNQREESESANQIKKKQKKYKNEFDDEFQINSDEIVDCYKLKKEEEIYHLEEDSDD